MELDYIESNCLYNANLARIDLADLKCGLQTEFYILDDPNSLTTFDWKNNHVYTVGYSYYIKAIFNKKDWPLMNAGHSFNVIVFDKKVYVRESSFKEYKYKQLHVFDNVEDFTNRFMSVYANVLLQESKKAKGSELGYEIDILANKIDKERMVFPKGAKGYIKLNERDTVYQNHMIREALQIPFNLTTYTFYQPYDIQFVYASGHLYTVDFKIKYVKNSVSHTFHDAIFISVDRYFYKVKHGMDYIQIESIKDFPYFLQALKIGLEAANDPDEHGVLAELLMYGYNENHLKSYDKILGAENIYYEIVVYEAIKRFDLPIEKIVIDGEEHIIE